MVKLSSIISEDDSLIDDDDSCDDSAGHGKDMDDHLWLDNGQSCLILLCWQIYISEIKTSNNPVKKNYCIPIGWSFKMTVKHTF